MPFFVIKVIWEVFSIEEKVLDKKRNLIPFPVFFRINLGTFLLIPAKNVLKIARNKKISMGTKKASLIHSLFYQNTEKNFAYKF